MQNPQAHLLLADGTVFTGKRFGALNTGPAVGELVFTTAMTGYQETLTDPSFTGQFVCHTFPLIGNCGINSFDSESARAWPSAYIVREWCEQPSNFRCETTLDAYLKEQHIPGLFGIDTRALTRRLRRYGSINATLLDNLPQGDALQDTLDALKKATPLAGAVLRVSCKKISTLPAEVQRKHRVVLYDYGTKRAIARQLTKRGCEVIIVPCDTSAETAASFSPDGFLLSNGPGNPFEYTALVEIVKQLTGMGKPLFGICIGHQLLALAMGASTEKLLYGHRGENQPVTDLASGRTFVTSQSHSYSVKPNSLTDKIGIVSYKNANDGSVEGLSYLGINAFSVQFHPEACAGPEDTAFLFDRFVASL